MLKRLALCLLLLSPLAACATAPAYAQAPTAEIVIDDDPGGDVDQQVRWMRRAEDAGVAFRFRGICDSACVFNLHNPNKCVEPTASFGIHQTAVNGIRDSMATGATARRWLPEVLVRAVYAMERAGWPSHGRPVYISAETMVKAGVVAWCDGYASEPEADEGEVEPSK